MTRASMIASVVESELVHVIAVRYWEVAEYWLTYWLDKSSPQINSLFYFQVIVSYNWYFVLTFFLFLQVVYL
jgi:hypothetical protein